MWPLPVPSAGGIERWKNEQKNGTNSVDLFFFFLSFFRWNKPGCRRPSSAESLLRPLCQINFMSLLPKQPWHMCDFSPVWNWLQCEFRRGKKGGRSEHYPEITNSPAVWPSISIDRDFFLLHAWSCSFVQSLDMCVRLISHIWRDGRVSCADERCEGWSQNRCMKHSVASFFFLS